MVEKFANKVILKDRNQIQKVFEENAHYFAKNNKHHSKKMKKLFSYYNKYFSGLTVSFEEQDVECEECQNTIIKLWSTIIYDLWERKIV